MVIWKLWTNCLFSLPRREVNHLLERGGHLHPLLPRMWRENCSIFGWIWTKWLQQKQRAFWRKKISQKMRTILSSSPQKIYLEKSHYFKGFCCFSIAIAVNGGQGTHFLISQILKGLTHCALYWILLWPGLWAMNIQNKFADCGKEFSSPIWLNKHNQEYHKKTSPTVTSVKESST